MGGPPDVPDNRKNVHHQQNNHPRMAAHESAPCAVIQNQNYQQYSPAQQIISYEQPFYSASDSLSSMTMTSYSYSNFTTTDTTDTLPIIQGDIMLPAPLSSGDVTGQGGTMVEGSSTISNLSVMSQPGSV